jgi:hypothetical protein
MKNKILIYCKVLAYIYFFIFLLGIAGSFFCDTQIRTTESINWMYIPGRAFIPLWIVKEFYNSYVIKILFIILSIVGLAGFMLMPKLYGYFLLMFYSLIRVINFLLRFIAIIWLIILRGVFFPPEANMGCSFCVYTLGDIVPVLIPEIILSIPLFLFIIMVMTYPELRERGQIFHEKSSNF